ncbi:hypothetical protein BN13_1880002 [Nostocoides jenkinsii Ben 74]|uniref:Uncharacterized protein n=1 Tax=Nostocoides jenkinsii Ben 74 TaxID=1193518 RepID=A0A077M9P4_9MICO|nr:hypothetical protein BN13_1880002 [Tetrasphaera jenkinsii Ben 74]
MACRATYTVGRTVSTTRGSGSEAAGLEKAAGDVVGQVAEAEGGATQVLEATVEGFGGAIGGAGAVEVGEDVRGAFLQSPAQGSDLFQRGRDAGADGVDDGLHPGLAGGPAGVAVGADHPLVDAPCRLHFDMLLDGEQRLQAGALTVGEEVRAGVQGAAGSVKRVAFAAAVAGGGLLNPAACLIEGVPGEADHVERVKDRDRGRKFMRAAAVLKPVNPSIATTSMASRQA